MLFHTPTFAAFFAAFLALYLPVRRTLAGRLIIVIFSFIFYGWWDWRFLPLLWLVILTDFNTGRLIARTESAASRRVWLLLSVFVDLGILGLFKYWNFFLESGRAAGFDSLGALEITGLILPLGISFYVFQSLSYVVDVYRRKRDAEPSLTDYAAYVSFFPQLVAGPIERADHLMPQLHRPDRLTATRWLTGGFWFAMGMYLKSVGDLLAAYHDPVFADLAAATPATVLGALLSFSFQIYCDFCGYSLMAVAVARVLGIDLVWNFEAPYLAASVRTFWRRWHISLSTWIRDYLYISLGGNRRGKSRQVGNLVFAMAVCGLWHGAGWNFVIWGALHGVYLAVNLFLEPAAQRLNLHRPWTKLPVTLLGWTATILLVFYAWLYFRCTTTAMWMTANTKLAEWLAAPAWPVVPVGAAALLVPVLLMDLAFARYHHGHRDLIVFDPHRPLGPWSALGLGLASGALFAVCLLLLAGRDTVQFIYFQF